VCAEEDSTGSGWKRKIRAVFRKNPANDRLPFAVRASSLRGVPTMKALSILTLALLITPLHSQQEGQAPAAAANEAELLPNQREFLNMPEERRREFINHVAEASRLFQQKRIFETLEELEKADKIFDKSPEVFNLRGSCYVEMRAFDKALAAFYAAAELSPGTASIEFNIGEVYFVTREWQKSHDRFQKVLANTPPENIALGRLVEFKILLCKKKLGQRDEAVALAEKYDYLDDSPYYYYAQAALAYDDGDLVKAEEWLARAGRIFQDPNILAPWQDTLVEFGYIKSFYGEDQGLD
jgi:tetratricopeptide (TPR) repeat protein